MRFVAHGYSFLNQTNAHGDDDKQLQCVKFWKVHWAVVGGTFNCYMVMAQQLCYLPCLEPFDLVLMY